MYDCRRCGEPSGASGMCLDCTATSDAGRALSARRMVTLTAEQRSDHAREMSLKRWAKVGKRARSEHGKHAARARWDALQVTRATESEE